MPTAAVRIPVFRNHNKFPVSLSNGKGGLLTLRPGETVVGEYFRKFIGRRSISLVDTDPTEATHDPLGLARALRESDAPEAAPAQSSPLQPAKVQQIPAVPLEETIEKLRRFTLEDSLQVNEHRLRKIAEKLGLDHHKFATKLDLVTAIRQQLKLEK